MSSQLTVAQRNAIEKAFGDKCERWTVEQLLDKYAINAVIPLNDHLAEWGTESIPEPGPEWDGYIAVIFEDGQQLLVVDPWGDVDGDFPGW